MIQHNMDLAIAEAVAFGPDPLSQLTRHAYQRPKAMVTPDLDRSITTSIRLFRAKTAS